MNQIANVVDWVTIDRAVEINVLPIPGLVPPTIIHGQSVPQPEVVTCFVISSDGIVRVCEPETNDLGSRLDIRWDPAADHEMPFISYTTGQERAVDKFTEFLYLRTKSRHQLKEFIAGSRIGYMTLWYGIWTWSPIDWASATKVIRDPHATT